jgi:hypothetical protein
VFASTTDRRIYLNGANKGTNATNIAAPIVTNTAIGAYKYTTIYYDDFDGYLAEAAMWIVALTDDDAVVLAAGYSPLLVRPEALAAYWPIIGRTNPEIDLVGGIGLTVTGATVADHPRVLYPSNQILRVKGASAAPATGKAYWPLIHQMRGGARGLTGGFLR